MRRPGVLIVGHGSRDAGANAEFEALVVAYRERTPDRTVAHAYVELAPPALDEGLDAIAREADDVTVVPLFLFAAGHVKNDVPLALAGARRRHPAVRFTATPALGVDPALLDVAFERVEAALRLSSGAESISSIQDGSRKKVALIVVGRGSSDPDANGDFCKIVRLIGEGRGFGWVIASFIGITEPRVEEALELVARARPERIVVLPYFLFAGRLIEVLGKRIADFRSRYPWIPAEIAPHLGGDARLLALIDRRARESGPRPLACDACQYRVPIAGVRQEVGGLRALLYSVRHAFTHTQAMPHVHAHRPLAKHVLICGNADCADRGSIALLAELRRLVKELGRKDIAVTRTSCMGRCGEGPTVAVYPDGVWYRGVSSADARELLESHLLKDRLVGRLIDAIMQ